MFKSPVLVKCILVMSHILTQFTKILLKHNIYLKKQQCENDNCLNLYIDIQPGSKGGDNGQLIQFKSF